MNVVELPVDCNAEGTDEAERLNLDPPEPIVMRSTIQLRHIVAWNEVEADDETIMYMSNGNTIGVRLPYAETTRRIEEAARG